MQTGRNGARAHAEHRPGHAGCSIGHYFNGTQTPHPHQVMAPPNSRSQLRENEIVIEDDESAFPEGKARYRQHRSLERDSKITRRAKAKRLKETGKLECEVCRSDFSRRYGARGSGFIEAHHKTPVSQLLGKRRTKMEDLALVCSNCHRMLHRGESLLTIEQLRDDWLTDA
jgi:predicted HNH restriction endonuclease